MRQFVAFIKKEYLHIFRDNRTLLVVLGMPMVLIILFGFAINMDVKDIRVAIYNPSPDPLTIDLAERIKNNSYYNFRGTINNIHRIEELMIRGEIDLAVIFQDNFQEELIHLQEAAIQLMTNCSDPNRGSVVITYTEALIYNLIGDMLGVQDIPLQINVENRMIYNPQMKSAYMFVPGIMGLVLMVICTIMTSVTVVREKERGSMEVLLVSPLNRGSMIFAKTVPYLIVSIINLISILLLSHFVLGVPIRGNVFLLFFISILYIFLSLLYGLTISTLVQKQINAIILAAITVFIPVLILSGMIFPIENMPPLLQLASTIVPSRWYISAIKKIMIQGLSFKMIWKEALIMVAMALFLLAVTSVKSKRRLE